MIKKFKKDTYKDPEFRVSVGFNYPSIWFSKAWCPNFKHIAICMRYKSILYSLTLYSKF